MDIAMKELVQMLTERCEQLHDGFVSGTIDFWTDSHRREQYGSFVIDFPAEKYEFENGEDSKSVPFWYHVPLWYHYKFDADIFLLY